MKRQFPKTGLSQLCQSARHQLDDHHLNVALSNPRLAEETKARQALYLRLQQQLSELNSDQSSSPPRHGGD